MTTSYKNNCIMIASGNAGTGNVTISKAVVGRQSLGAGDDGVQFLVKIYTIDSDGQASSDLWEVQTSTWTNSSKTLSRSSGTVVDGSSGAGTLVNFAAGTQYVEVTSAVGAAYSGTANQISVTGTTISIPTSPIFPGTVRSDSHYGTITTDADGATVTFDMSVSNIHLVTLGSDRILAVSSDNNGQAFLVILKQDVGGSRTVTWWSGILWPGGIIPTLTITGGKYDMFSFLRISSGVYFGFTIGLNL